MEVWDRESKVACWLVMEFKKALEDAAKQFLAEHKGRTIGVISHNDTDGITSAAIIVEALQRLKLKFHLMFLTRSEDVSITDQINEFPYEIFLLLDYGSKEAPEIAEKNKDKKFYILDHHLSGLNKIDNVIDVNPNYFGIDGVILSHFDIVGSIFLFCIIEAVLVIVRSIYYI